MRLTQARTVFGRHSSQNSPLRYVCSIFERATSSMTSEPPLPEILKPPNVQDPLNPIDYNGVKNDFFLNEKALCFQGNTIYEVKVSQKHPYPERQ
jgi:hypothetical protein